jgi:nitrogen fixation NifU-like protein
MTCEWEQYRESTKEEKEAVYSKTAFEYATNPKNLGEIENADGFASVTGPCGDTMQIWLKINGGNITDAAFITDGCGNAIASCGMATEMCKGKMISEAQKIEQQDILAALDGLPEEGEHCALLAANTLKATIENYLSRQT